MPLDSASRELRDRANRTPHNCSPLRWGDKVAVCLEGEVRKLELTFWFSVAVWTGMALYENNMAAAYVSLGLHWVAFTLIRLEAKINRLLLNQGLSLSGDE
jgi:hypothetical protein